MAWLSLILAEGVSPVGTATSDIVSYVLSFGVLGVAAVLYTLRIIVPAKAADKATADAVSLARADLLAERERLVLEKERAEELRDEALKIAQVQLVPMLVTFNATVSALLPVLQDMVRERENGARGQRGGR